jgi:hypothetical protein
MAKQKITESKQKTEGGKTFKRIENSVDLFICISDAQDNVVYMSDKETPMTAGLVTDTSHNIFAAATHKEMADEAAKRKLKL